MNRTLDLFIVSGRSTHLDRPQPGHLDCTDVGHALQEVEAGQQQLLLGVGSHAQQVVLAKVAVYECQEIALGVVDGQLREHLYEEMWRRAFGELRRRCQTPQAGFVDVFRDRWRSVPAVLHGLEGDEQDVDRLLKQLHVDPVASQHEDMPWIVSLEPRRLHQAHHHGRALASEFAVGEQPCPAAHGSRLYLPL